MTSLEEGSNRVCSFPTTWVRSRGSVRECAGWTADSVALDGAPADVVAEYLVFQRCRRIAARSGRRR